jgi:hypothetical protein
MYKIAEQQARNFLPIVYAFNITNTFLILHFSFNSKFKNFFGTTFQILVLKCNFLSFKLNISSNFNKHDMQRTHLYGFRKENFDFLIFKSMFRGFKV